MRSGIIVFEDGEAVTFGTIASVSRMISGAEKILQELAQEERRQILASVREDEMKGIVERIASSKDT